MTPSCGFVAELKSVKITNCTNLCRPLKEHSLCSSGYWTFLMQESKGFRYQMKSQLLWSQLCINELFQVILPKCDFDLAHVSNGNSTIYSRLI